jgi:hypothetical protein
MKRLAATIAVLIAVSALASGADAGSIAIDRCPGTTGMCLRAVRIAVQKAKGMPLKGDVLYAKDFGPVLVEKYKAKPLPIRDPKKAPIGAIIVYDSAAKSKNPAGHVEIKTKIGYVSDHISKQPYPGPVKGIYLL